MLKHSPSYHHRLNPLYARVSFRTEENNNLSLIFPSKTSSELLAACSHACPWHLAHVVEPLSRFLIIDIIYVCICIRTYIYIYAYIYIYIYHRKTHIMNRELPSVNQTWHWKIHYLPIENPSSSGFPMATFDYRRVNRSIARW